MRPTHNTLSESVRAQPAQQLNLHPVGAAHLQGQLKQAYWTVRGPPFIAIHELFDEVAETVDGYADDIAERAAALGSAAERTVQVAAERSFLIPDPLRIDDEKRRLFAVASTLASFGQATREAAGFGDAGAADLFTAISRALIAGSGPRRFTPRQSDTTRLEPKART
jgi:starvation-inducible DNA-binding protein